MKRKVPYDQKEDCCGCTLCYALCPVHAIEMISDEEGFLYPIIHQDICIGCGECAKQCEFNKMVN
jgi:Fe-S-cluster-containing hydrogenase component 2